MNIFSGIFLILHGLVHFWYVVLSFGLVPFQSEMGWTGESWLISKLIAQKPIKSFAGSLFVIAGILFFISGIAVLTNANGFRNLLMLSSIFSTLILLIYWDGQINMLVQKGILGVLINIIIALIALFYL